MARVNTPDVAEAREEREAQMSPKARELEEPVAQEERDTYHTRRKGPHIQKEDLERQSTARVEKSTNQEEFRIKEGTVGDGCHNTTPWNKAWENPVRSSRQSSHRQPTTGASIQLKQGGGETGEEVTRAPGRPRLEEP